MHTFCKITKDYIYPEYKKFCPDSGRTATPQQRAGKGVVSCHVTPEWCLVVGGWAHWRHARGQGESGKQQQGKHSSQLKSSASKAAEEVELSPSCWTSGRPDLRETVRQGLKQAGVHLPGHTTAVGNPQEKQHCVFEERKHCLKCFMALLLIAKCLGQLKCPNWW